MLGACSALLTALVAAVAATAVYDHEELEAQNVLADLKARILAGLGMERPPDMRNVNISVEHVQRMTRRYFKNLRQSEQELLTYHQTDFSKDNYLIFNPEMEYISNFQWARLRFPNSTFMDISSTVRKWKEKSTNVLQVECHEKWCSKAKLEIMVRKSRRKRSVCNRECCRRPLRISFKEIGWDWIVQPAEFEAFYCKGRCRNVSDDFASTHALMQSILNYKGRKVTRPCCAPRKLRPLDLLHYNDKTPPELVVTRQKGMIVKECACA